MQRGVGRGRPPPDEAVRRGMRRDAHEELTEHEALRGLQPLLGSFDHPRRRAVRPRDPAVAVVPQPLVPGAPLERADVRQPGERPARHAEEVGEILRARELGHPEAPTPHRGRERPHPDDARRRDARRSRPLERGGDERGELPRRVERRAVVLAQDGPHDGAQPSRARREHRAAAPHERLLVPHAREERSREGVADLAAGSGGVHGGGDDAARRFLRRACPCLPRAAASGTRCTAVVLRVPPGVPRSGCAPRTARGAGSDRAVAPRSLRARRSERILRPPASARTRARRARPRGARPTSARPCRCLTQARGWRCHR